MFFIKTLLLLSVTTVTTRLIEDNINIKYIIVLKDESTAEDVEKVMQRLEEQEQKDRQLMEMESLHNLSPMIIAKISEETASKIAEIPEVDYIEKEQPVYMLPISDREHRTSYWLQNAIKNVRGSTNRYNLDIINNPSYTCRNYRYTPPNDGTGVDIYILDTGINYHHKDFKDANGNSRAKYGGFEPVSPRTYGLDCQGHGSHCAGIAGGLTSGVAKGANLLSIRVLSCTGSGTSIAVISALNFIAEVHNKKSQKKDFVGSVVSLSLGGGKSQSINQQVNRLVAAGVIVVTASGNEGVDACDTSPGSAGLNINVGAHSEPIWLPKVGCKNPIEAFSNWGRCVDVIAPGRDIVSVDYMSIEGFVRSSGTSMACPHVAGAAAVIKQGNKLLTPKQVKTTIVRGEARDIDRTEQSNSVRMASHSQRLFIPSIYTKLFNATSHLITNGLQVR